MALLTMPIIIYIGLAKVEREYVMGSFKTSLSAVIPNLQEANSSKKNGPEPAIN